MSDVCTAYVRRHLLIGVNRTKGLILMVLADVADDGGRARMTQPMLVSDIGCSLTSIQRFVSALIRDRYLTKGGGRTYVIVGVAGHDVMICPHVECAAEAEAIRQGSGSARKRALAAARARKAREKRKREAAQTV